MIIFRPSPPVEVETVLSSALHDTAFSAPLGGEVTPTPTKIIPANDVEKMICELWGDKCDEAIAVFKAESGLRADAQGYNCWFEDGQVVSNGAWATHRSGACPIDQRHMAWSVDCGVAQMNVNGQVCPQEYLDPQWNIQKAYEWKYLTRNETFTAWVAYTSGSYKRFLANY